MFAKRRRRLRLKLSLRRKPFNCVVSPCAILHLNLETRLMSISASFVQIILMSNFQKFTLTSMEVPRCFALSPVR